MRTPPHFLMTRAELLVASFGYQEEMNARSQIVSGHLDYGSNGSPFGLAVANGH